MTHAHDLLKEDKALKNVAHNTPKHEKPQFEWSALTAGVIGIPMTGNTKVRIGSSERDFDVGEIADTVGNAITDLLMARQRQSEIFNDSNRQLVQAISRAVAEEVAQRTTDNGAEAPMLSTKEIYQVIEQALVRHNAHDVARSLAERRKRTETLANSDANDAGALQPIMVTTKVIRRNGQLVPWNHNKIEIAVRKAFLSMEMDSTPAVQVAESVSRAIINDGKQFMHIEDVQNLVEEELMKQGFFKVARAYIQYRALRSNMRETELEVAAVANEQDSEQQQALLVVALARRLRCRIVLRFLVGVRFFGRGLRRQVRAEVAVIQPPAWSRTAHTFSHIFAGGYAAGYYSYKWAEVLSADAYAAFEETALPDGSPNLETGKRYREAILEAGGSRPALASFIAFRGREPSLNALLRHQGMMTSTGAANQ